MKLRQFDLKWGEYLGSQDCPAVIGFSPHTGRLLDLSQRQTQLSQRDDLLFLLFAQDITHGGETSSPELCPGVVGLRSYGINGRF
jgi:hypothetical protein